MADIPPIRVYIGDDWLVQVALVDTLNNPINLAGATVGANFWTNNLLPPVDLVAAGGGVLIVSVNPGVVLLTVPRSVTAGLDQQQSVLSKTFACRAQIYLDDSRNRQQTAALLPFQPLSPRDTDLPSALAVMTTVTAVLSPQGPAGPAQTINGHTGPTITLTAADVGAYTKAEVDAAITMAVRAQFGADFMLWFASLPTDCPSLTGQPWNNGGTFAVS